MRFLHLSDLHLGKIVHGFNLIEDQKFALQEIVKLIKKENIETVLISGDIYQSAIAKTDAINVFSNFLFALSKLNVNVLVISGNHDSADRLAYARDLLKDSNIYIAEGYNGEIEKIALYDEFGAINFYLFPYIKPVDVRRYFPEKDISSYTDAVAAVINNININENERNVILSHQFILNASLSESEEIFAGVLEAVPAKTYEKFDYVALGHIHKAQSFMNGKLRYPGALLKYSKTEAGYKKSLTIVELAEKGSLKIEETKIDYLRDMRIIKGYFDEIVKNSIFDETKEDYIHIELFDEDEKINALNHLREIYPNIMTFKYKKNEIVEDNEELFSKAEIKSPLELFEEFYTKRLQRELSEDKKNIMKKAIEEVWGA